MKMINNNKIDLKVLEQAIAKPELFKKSTHKFWDDEHVAKQMLQFHLNPEIEAASKTNETIQLESDFIISITKMNSKKSVLDLGCGPGLYVEKFAKTGAKVTGIDISNHSIQYAQENIQPNYNNTSFQKMNYLDMHFRNAFDIATLIFYDFCALNTDEQSILLNNIYKALKDNGIFILDVVTENRNTLSTNTTSIVNGGFWSPDPYIEMFNTFIYEDPKTEGLQYTIIEESGEMKVIRIYHRLFNLEEITQLLNHHNFEVEKIYNSLKGDTLNTKSETYGIVARKV